MNLGLNWVDLAILGTLLFFSIEAIGRPLIWEFFFLIGFFLSAILSFSYYNIPASYLEKEFAVAHGVSLIMGFMAIWFLTEILFYLLLRVIIPKLPKIKIPHARIFSILPALIRTLILIAIALVLLSSFPIQPYVKRVILDSKLGSRILNYASGLEGPVKKVFGGAANDSMTFLTVKPNTKKINLGFQTSGFTTDHESEKSMIEMVNKERILLGLKELKLDENLRAIARGYSADMLKGGYFSHYSPEGKSVADRLKEGQIDFFQVGENLAYAPTLELAFKGLMNSPTHKAIMLSADYERIGIGAMDAGIYGKMFTQVFAY